MVCLKIKLCSVLVNVQFDQKTFETYQIGNAYLKSYNDGSDKYNLLNSETGNSTPSKVTSLRNQMFIMFITDGNIGGKGFTAKIIFGSIIMIQCYLEIHIFWDQEFSVN